MTLFLTPAVPLSLGDEPTHVSLQLKPKQWPETLEASTRQAAESRESQRFSKLPKLFHENRKGRVVPERAWRGGHRFLSKTVKTLMVSKEAAG